MSDTNLDNYMRYWPFEYGTFKAETQLSERFYNIKLHILCTFVVSTHSSLFDTIFKSSSSINFIEVNNH